MLVETKVRRDRDTEKTDVLAGSDSISSSPVLVSAARYIRGVEALDIRISNTVDILIKTSREVIRHMCTEQSDEGLLAQNTLERSPHSVGFALGQRNLPEAVVLSPQKEMVLCRCIHDLHSHCVSQITQASATNFVMCVCDSSLNVEYKLTVEIRYVETRRV